MSRWPSPSGLVCNISTSITKLPTLMALIMATLKGERKGGWYPVPVDAMKPAGSCCHCVGLPNTRSPIDAGSAKVCEYTSL